MADQLEVDLGQLFELLRGAGFRVDPRQYLTAAELLIETARLGEPIDTDAKRLRAHLGPIFCTSPEEQARFQQVVDKWLKKEPPPPPPPSPPPPFVRLRRARRAVGIVVALVAIVAAARVGHDQYKKAHIVQPPPPPPPEPLAPSPEPDAGPPPALRVVAGPSFTPTFDVAQPPPTRKTTWWWVALAAGGTGAVVLIMWFGVGWLRRRLVLQRLPSEQRSELTKLADGGDGGPPLFDDLAIRRASAALRRPRPEAAQELEILASVEGAARGAGLVAPIYRRRRAIPEYVAFIERHSAADHQARLNDELLDRLKTLGVAVERYYFSGDPRTCFEGASSSRSTLLADAVGRNHRAAALLFLDPGRCFNPYTGAPEPWLETLRPCPRRALLTTEPPRAWTRHAADLAALGVVVVSAGEQGLTTFGELEGEAEVERRGPIPYARPYPRLLASQPAIATIRVCPRADVVERLVRELEGYLGPRAFTWLAACAAYPEIDWSLTLHLAQAVWATTDGPAQKVDLRAHLTALARLPWFRLGSMPDWLRAALLSQLTHAQEGAVRVALAARLEKMARQTLAQRGGVEASQIQIGAWVDPIELVRTAHPDSAMNDAVFLGYMGGARIPSVAVEAPSAFRRLFGRVRALPDERRVRAADRTWRQRLAASLRTLRVYHPALAGLLLALAGSGVAFAVALPLSTTVTVARRETPQLASLAFDPAGDRLVVAGGRDLEMWSLDGKHQVTVQAPFTIIESEITSVSYRVDGTLVVRDKSGAFYEAGRPKAKVMALSDLHQTIGGHAIADLLRGKDLPADLFSYYGPAPERLLVALGKRAFVWKGSEFVGDVDALLGADVSADGKVLATVNAAGTAISYRTSDLREIKTLSFDEEVSSPVLSRDGSLLLLIGRTSAHVVRLSGLSAISRVDVPERYRWAGAVGFNRDADLVLLEANEPASPSNVHFFVWDLLSETTAEVTPTPGHDFQGALSDDGRTVAIYDRKSVQLLSIERNKTPKPDAGAEVPDAGTDGPSPSSTPIGPPPPRPRKCPALSSVPIDVGGNVAAGGDVLIKANAACISKHPEWKKIDVVGATGSRGTAEYNRSVSKKYAERVRDLLVKAGVPASRLQASGKGEEWLLCHNTSDDCEKRNRRVEVQVPGETITPPTPDAGPPVAPSPPDAGSTSTVHLTATGPVSVQFGGSPYCSYEAAMSNIDLSFVIEGKANVRNAQVTATFSEKGLNGCPHAPIPRNDHLYALRSARMEGDSIIIDFQQRSGEPKATASFKGSSTNGVLTFVRTDEPGAESLKWLLAVPIPSKGPIVNEPNRRPQVETKPQTQTRPETSTPSRFQLDMAKAKVVVLDTQLVRALGDRPLGIKPADVFAAKPRLAPQIESCLAGKITPGASGVLRLGLLPHDRTSAFQGTAGKSGIDIVSVAVEGLRAAEQSGSEMCLRSFVLDDRSSPKPTAEIAVPFTDDTLLPRPPDNARTPKAPGRRAD